jgi:hypothetical protein
VISADTAKIMFIGLPPTAFSFGLRILLGARRILGTAEKRQRFTGDPVSKRDRHVLIAVLPSVTPIKRTLTSFISSKISSSSESRTAATVRRSGCCGGW